MIRSRAEKIRAPAPLIKASLADQLKAQVMELIGAPIKSR